MPSTIYKGELLALIEPIPRIRMVASPLAGSPEEEMTCTPGVVPARALVTFVVTLDSIVSAPIIEAEPVNALFVEVPYATTMVSSMYSVSCSNATSSFCRPSTATCLVL